MVGWGMIDLARIKILQESREIVLLLGSLFVQELLLPSSPPEPKFE